MAVAVAGLALLMVSTVRYRTFKDARPNRKSTLVFMLMVLGGVVIATQFHPAWVLVACCGAYLALGLVESAVQVRSHLVARKVASGAVAAVAVASVIDEEDEDAEAEEDPGNDGPAYL
jgi:CDP-diacylglycerol--serine O-phosphatidyltransferase